MKRAFLGLLVSVVLALSFAVTASATEAETLKPTYSTVEQDVSPFTEMTRMYWRMQGGVLQWRLWSITNGRWLSDWTTVHPV